MHSWPRLGWEALNKEGATDGAHQARAAADAADMSLRRAEDSEAAARLAIESATRVSSGLASSHQSSSGYVNGTTKAVRRELKAARKATARAMESRQQAERVVSAAKDAAARAVLASVGYGLARGFEWFPELCGYALLEDFTTSALPPHGASTFYLMQEEATSLEKASKIHWAAQASGAGNCCMDQGLQSAARLSFAITLVHRSGFNETAYWGWADCPSPYGLAPCHPMLRL